MVYRIRRSRCHSEGGAASYQWCTESVTIEALSATYTQDDIPLNVCIEDLKVIPDPDLAMELVLEASKRQERSGKLDPEQGSSQMRAHPVWLYSADSSDMAREVEHRNMNLGS